MLEFVIALMIAVSTPCASEDSAQASCYWDSANRGNGYGVTYLMIDDHYVPLFRIEPPVVEEEIPEEIPQEIPQEMEVGEPMIWAAPDVEMIEVDPVIEYREENEELPFEVERVDGEQFFVPQLEE